jgi:excisionase family DNA binding protein
MTARKDPLSGLDPDSTLTIPEAADRLGISARLVRKEIQKGHLPAHIPGKRGEDAGKRSGRLGYRILPADLRKWFFGK